MVVYFFHHRFQEFGFVWLFHSLLQVHRVFIRQAQWECKKMRKVIERSVVECVEKCVDVVDAVEIKQSNITSLKINPYEYGFKLCSIESLQGGTAKQNAQLLMDALSGATNPIADAFILNDPMC